MQKQSTDYGVGAVCSDSDRRLHPRRHAGGAFRNDGGRRHPPGQTESHCVPT